MKFYVIEASWIMQRFNLTRFKKKLDNYLSCGRQDVLEHLLFFEENVCSKLVEDKDFSLFQRVSTPEEADILVFGLYLEFIAYWFGDSAGWKLIEIFKTLEQNQKLTIAYWNHDTDFSPANEFVPKNVVILNQGYTSSPGPRDILLPFWIAESFPDCEKVQFASFIGTPNNELRRKLVNAIHKYNRPDIIAATQSFGENYKRAIAMTMFCLCPKGGLGGGGFSYRVFEVLQAGSIPVILVDSLCYPMTEIIPWDKICIRIPESKAEDIPYILSVLESVDKDVMLCEIEDVKPLLSLRSMQQYIHRRILAYSTNV
jgi:hypothetical protein